MLVTYTVYMFLGKQEFGRLGMILITSSKKVVVNKTAKIHGGKYPGDESLMNPLFIKKGYALKMWRLKSENPENPGKKLTQKKLAELLNVPHAKISSFENGFTKIPEELENRIAKLLKVPGGKII